jgi:hypothetical protein
MTYDFSKPEIQALYEAEVRKRVDFLTGGKLSTNRALRFASTVCYFLIN